jgi:hypothetical protein
MKSTKSMRSTKLTRLVLLSAALPGLAATACASVGDHGTGVGAGGGVIKPTATTSSQTILLQQDAAELALFSLPVGARELSGAPAGISTAMLAAPFTQDLIVTPVRLTQWWAVKQSPASMESELTTQANTISKDQDEVSSGSTGGGASFVQIVELDLPADSAALDRSVTMQIVPLPAPADGDVTLVKISAGAALPPVRPAAETLPITPVLIVNRGADSGLPPARKPTPAASVVITDRATIAKVVAILNAMPLSLTDGPVFCPAETGGGYTLDFRASKTGPDLARVAWNEYACGGVQVSVSDKTLPSLSGGSELGSLEQQLNKLL